jgi:hypothetical protein
LIIEIAKALRDGTPVPEGDLGVVSLSALDLALSSLSLLAGATGKPAAEWCRLLALGAAAGEGVVAFDLAGEAPTACV